MSTPRYASPQQHSPQARSTALSPQLSHPLRLATWQVIECILMLVNALVGFPEELKVRVKLRAEFIRLQLLDILAALHRERHVEVVRQVEVFESEMLEDTDEIAKLEVRERRALRIPPPLLTSSRPAHGRL